VESNDRFYRRRANEEMKAAGRAVTEEARERRMRLAGIFLERLKASERRDVARPAMVAAPSDRAAFGWRGSRALEEA
jgi:hypothetical protein